MRLFDRSRPRDTSALYGALTTGDVAAFEEHYRSSYVGYRYHSGTLLTLSLLHGGAISHRLLDDGADVSVGHPLHVLLGHNSYDMEHGPGLLERMLDLGADVNGRTTDGMTPLEEVAGRFKYSDTVLTPFYDVLLARPDLDLLGPGTGGRPVLVNLRRWTAKRSELVRRCEALLVERGVAVPDPEGR